jgi:hypothetical protein
MAAVERETAMGGRRWRTALGVLTTALALLASTAGPLQASPTSPPAPTAAVVGPATATSPGGGTVYAITQIGNRTIIGGEFTTVGGLPRRNLAALLPDGSVDPTWNPSPDGIVYALATDSLGTRVFAGGTFASIGGSPRQRLAALDPSSGTALPGWSADADDTVFALSRSGDRLYVGGRYTALGATRLKRLAAVDVKTSAVVTSFKPRPNWTVRAVGVAPGGTKVYAVGGFDTIGGVSRKNAAELHAVDGAATAFAPTESGFGLAMALSPDGQRFFFATANNRLYAYEPAVSNSPVFTVKTSGDTQAIAVSQTEVYIGGHFSWIGSNKFKRGRLGSVSSVDGSTTTWNPQAGTSHMGIWALLLADTSLHVGGDFQRMSRLTRQGYARFDSATL